jgi:hypothetical protein
MFVFVVVVVVVDCLLHSCCNLLNRSLDVVRMPSALFGVALVTF